MKKITFILALFLLTSCANFKLATLNHTPTVTQEGILVDVIDSEFSLYKKFDRDDTFRWNYSQFAKNQDLRWYYSFYNQNNLWRYNRNVSPWDLYVNRYDYWFNWNFNFGFSRFNHWDPYRFRQWGWNSYDPYYSNFHIWNRPSMAHMNRYRQSNQIDIENRERSNRVRSRSIVTNNNVRIYTRPELNENKLRESVNLLKGRNSNIIVREYNNLDKYNNKNIIIKNNNKPIRNYGRPEGSNSNIIKNIPPPRNYSPPPPRNNITGRSSNVKININRKD
ncbi:hypothetical protein N9Z86_00610 [bacterium]|nr:hypothetical protein [bacterium]